MQRAFACLEYSPGTIAPTRILRVFPLFSFSFFSSFHSHPPMTFPFSPHSSFCLRHGKNRFWQLILSICLSVCLAKIYFLVCGVDKCVVSRVLSRRGWKKTDLRSMSTLVNRFLISVSKVNMSANQCFSLIKIKMWINWFRLVPLQTDGLWLNAEFLNCLDF